MASKPAGSSQALPDGLSGGLDVTKRVRGPIELAPWVIGALTLALRIATAARGPTDWDSSQYAEAVGRFDVAHGRPQPPGYWLYVESGRLMRAVLGLGTVHALVLVAALASALAAGVTVLAGRALGGRWVGIAAGFLVATSPFAWFSGSIVATYSFDALACVTLVWLAWRAHPGSWHGVGAAVTLGLLSGFRQSILQSFAILAVIAVVGSTRRWRQAVVTIAAGLAAVAVWFVPMIAQQPGGLSAWVHATRTEAAGAFQVTSLLVHSPGAPTNLGTFAAYTVVALAPLAAVSILAGLVIGVSRMIGRHEQAPPASVSQPGPAVPLGQPCGPTRPWYQGRAAILVAAIVPPAALVALVQFAKGGYLLAYLPAAVIALLLPVGSLVYRRRRTRAHRHARRSSLASPGWLVGASFLVLAIAGLGAQRFLSGNGVLPQRWLRPAGGLWLQDPRYQAPYTDTRSAIQVADQIDAAIGGLATVVGNKPDVLVFDTVDGGANIYRNAGWSLPNVRIALIGNGTVLYNEIHGSLFYGSGNIVAAGSSGSVLLVASPALSGMASLTARGEAELVRTPRPIGGYLVWRLRPGATILGVHTRSGGSLLPLGGGI